MNSMMRDMLYAHLYEGLMGRMEEITRTIYILTGKIVDPVQLVGQMEKDLKKETEKISVGDGERIPVGLLMRKKIAQEVVADIKAQVLRSQR